MFDIFMFYGLWELDKQESRNPWNNLSINIKILKQIFCCVLLKYLASTWISLCIDTYFCSLLACRRRPFIQIKTLIEKNLTYKKFCLGRMTSQGFKPSGHIIGTATPEVRGICIFEIGLHKSQLLCFMLV